MRKLRLWFARLAALSMQERDGEDVRCPECRQWFPWMLGFRFDHRSDWFCSRECAVRQRLDLSAW